MTTATMERTSAKIVSHAEWLAARKQFLTAEKEFTRLRDELSRQRRELPWERVEKKYIFEGDKGKQTLADLFGHKNQLIVYHLMFGAGWGESCPSCAFIADQFDSLIPHLAARDTNLVAISRAPWQELSPFKERMGWKFPWLSSFGTDFNFDYQVSDPKSSDGKVMYNYDRIEFPSEELPGASVFFRKDGEIFHTYSTYGRGLDILLNAYNFLDLTPKGRDEEGLPWPMAWVRHHDKYSDPNSRDAMQIIMKKSCCEGK